MAEQDPRADADLIAATLAGDSRAFQALMERYQQPIFGYLYRLAYRNPDLARDLTQAVFLKAWENLASVDGSRPFSPWLYRIAHNEAANWQRSRHRHPTVALDPVTEDRATDPGAATPESSATEADGRRVLLAALDRLPPKYRHVLVLHFFEDRSYEDIAQILAVRLGTVGTLIHRAKVALRAELGEPEP
jgi:RNA polymerase sigma-70 factor (ECF subfamily)